MPDAPVTYTNSRDRHLLGPGPKCILSLDGGGLRGAVTVAFLEKIEELISQDKSRGQFSDQNQQSELSQPVRLGDFFDLIGGTSTGAIIAGSLALGKSTADLKHFYFERAPKVFKRRLHIPLVQSRYDAKLLHDEIGAICGNRTLGSEDFITGLALVFKNMQTASPMVLMNNPAAPYWNSTRDYIGMNEMALTNLIRASTAAPTYFDPVISPLFESGVTTPARSSLLQSSCMVDGGVTPHNNPALALLMMVLQDKFCLRWQAGPDNLTIVSIGTGSFRSPAFGFERGLLRRIRLAVRALESMIDDSSDLVLQLMYWLGKTPPELQTYSLRDGNLPWGAKKWFRFIRYNVQLDERWLRENLDMKMSDGEMRELRQMDNPKMIGRLYEIGRLAAQRQVKLEHFSAAGLAA
jgi:hypothetical protein